MNNQSKPANTNRWQLYMASSLTPSRANPGKVQPTGHIQPFGCLCVARLRSLESMVLTQLMSLCMVCLLPSDWLADIRLELCQRLTQCSALNVCCECVTSCWMGFLLLLPLFPAMLIFENFQWRESWKLSFSALSWSGGSGGYNHRWLR